ncbi:DUF7286 family protein [Halocalculus aciditolerans]|uniref:Uncharacterized protein n=1 Tax=Halocalculus aciditolerans TaxID=1383812 RepID=A0A830FGL7_9EURY|nr:hypothetical protein [Halocalculus aciditolerans]GGL72543.1 hypothetical protein GCM10009039_33140 [Halocalculus aciditolerans]
MTDERGRVPLALVGVALLVASAGVASHVSLAAPQATTPDTDAAAREATVLARLAVADGATRAARAAAAHPVVAPAGPYGDALRADHAFRDALRLRTYAAVRRALANTTTRRGDVTATVALPGIDSPADAERAIGRVHLAERADGGTNVTVTGLRLTLRRDGRVVSRETTAVTVAVATPVLGLHDRVADYAARLDAGPLDGPGLGRRLTARATVVAWGRGWAQYGGAPVANVLATRHVAVTTNAAVLGVQRETLGRADARATTRYRRAAVETGVQDLLGPSAGAVGGAPASPGLPGDAAGTLLGEKKAVSVDVNATADRAFLALDEDLDGVFRDTYRGRIRVETAATTLSTRRVNATAARAGVTAAERGPAVATPGGFVRLATRHRRVRTVRRVGNASLATTSLVTVAVVGRAAPDGRAPDRALVDQPTGLLRDASNAVVRARGGVDTLARRAADGGASTTAATVPLSVPENARKVAVRNVTRLHDRLTRALSTTLSPGAGLDANPRRRLADRLAEQRAALVDAPARYRSLDARAATAARAAYLDAVVERLRGETGGFDAVRRVVAAHADQPLAAATARPERTANASAGDSPVLSVRGTPSYLSTSRVDGRYPLATRNTNLFTVPYADAGDAVADAVVPDPPADASLASAVTTLRALDGVRGNATLRERRAALRSDVAAATDRLRPPLVDALARRTTLTEDARRAAVDAAFARYDGPAVTATAAVNGSLASTVAREAAARGADAPGLRIALRVALREARRTRGRVPGGRVTDARRSAQTALSAVTAEGANRIGDAAKREAAHRVADAGERVLGEKLDDAAARRAAKQRLAQLPAGLPIAPVPGYWYATANAWVVSARGGYERVAVTARTHTPGNDSLTYVRQNETVRVDVDGDGAREVVGRNEEVTFSVSTVVVVVVPPGPRGVGDTDGNADERSTGW